MSDPEQRPILYSFRRCPFAIRARLALAAAALAVEVREVALACKPPELLEASPKGTVPVLVVPPASPAAMASAPPAIDESLAIMRWALGRQDPQDWLHAGDPGAQAVIESLLLACDGPFKHHLDRFKYASRYGKGDRQADGAIGAEAHRQAALGLLRQWNGRLAMASGGAGELGWLLGPRPSLADWALLPFVRQFRLADPVGFDAAADLAALQAWLHRFLQGPELAAVLAEPWGPRRPWRSPRWLYHLALPAEWAAAQADGQYRRSSRGLSLEQVGFIHASYAHQLAGSHRRFYADGPGVLLLTIDPQGLAAAGVAVRAEPAPESQELFPHLYGPLPLAAVLAVERWQPEPEPAP